MDKLPLPEGLDELIMPAVKVLRDHGFKTFESCQSGPGHCFPEPTVRFEGTEFDLIRAYDICESYGLPVWEVRRVYRKTEICVKDAKGLSHSLGDIWEYPFNEITFLLELLRTQQAASQPEVSH